jgi:NitT/TauT family transport system substrate-binding protein
MKTAAKISRCAFLAIGPLVASATRSVIAQTPPPTAMRIGLTPSDGFGEAYYGHDAGFFDAAGIALELMAFNAEAAIVSAVLGGSLDVGISGPITVANAYAKGIPIAYISAGSIYSSAAPTLALIVAKTNTAQTAKDLEGKTLGVADIKGSIHLAGIAWLDRNGADIAKVKVVEIPRADIAGALQRGAIDAAVVGEPFLSASLSTTSRMFAKCFDVMGDGALLGGYFTTRDYAAKNAATLRRFNAAMYRTAKWANANRDKSAVILQKYTKISDDVVQRMTRVAFADALDPARIQTTLDIAYKERFLDHPVAARDLILKV